MLQVQTGERQERDQASESVEDTVLWQLDQTALLAGVQEAGLVCEHDVNECIWRSCVIMRWRGWCRSQG